MKERPILFSAPMVRAILAGEKTQTRRVLRAQPVHGVVGCHWVPSGFAYATKDGGCTCTEIRHAYGAVGDRLWVRETCALVKSPDVGDWRWPEDGEEPDAVWYRATDSLHLAASVGAALRPWIGRALNTYALVRPERWRPAIHMPRWASRLTLEITNIGVERLQGITEDDARAEGVNPKTWGADAMGGRGATVAYAELWDRINGEGAWASNPWVWVISFRRVVAVEARAA